MELALKPLNHLIAISPRLEGNILHNVGDVFATKAENARTAQISPWVL